METKQFDTLARAVGTGATRRLVVRTLAGGALGGLLIGPRAPGAGATQFPCRHRGDRCQDGTQCCSGICKHHRCRAHNKGICKVGQDACGSNEVKCGTNGPASCFCFGTTGKAPFCGGDSKTIACTRDEDCEVGTGPGSACVVCRGQTICVAPCPDPR